jgi:hypothetical protein
MNMSERAELQKYWQLLRQKVLNDNGGAISDDICVQISQKILYVCFRETKLDHPAILQWWLERSVIDIRNRVFAHNYRENAHLQMLSALTVQRLNQDIEICGSALIDSLCSKISGQAKAHALAHLSQQSDFHVRSGISYQAFQTISLLEPDAVLKTFKNHLLLLQAVAIVMCYLRSDMPGIKDHFYNSLEDFRAKYKDVKIKDGSRLLACSPAEEQKLFSLCNFMRIAHLFIPAERGKGVFR